MKYHASSGNILQYINFLKDGKVRQASAFNTLTLYTRTLH